MIILNQNKDELINFENIVRLSVDVNTDGEFLIEAHNFCDDFETVIGFYETEERAKEVLQEIIILFKDEEIFHIRKSTLNNLDELAEPKYILKPVSRPKIYEMPKE